MLSGAAKVDVIAHRGEHIECPENTMPAIEKAIALGVDWVEIDVRTTKDGSLVLMHDGGVERTTGGKGQVAELTLEEIRALDASDGKPGFGGTKVPTLDEALGAMRGKCGVYFDAKRVAAEAIVAGLKRHRMVERCVVYGGLKLMQDLTGLGFGFLAMPEAVSVEVSRRILAELQVKVIAFDARDFREEIVAVAREAKKGIFVDRRGAADTEEKGLEAVKMGATGIQTDHPGELVKLLRGRG
jgi:glycerophosphoryl diester phosphodiesterase